MPGRWDGRRDPLYLEAELAQTGAEGECKALLNIKVKMEAEITAYRCLLEAGEDFGLGDVLAAPS